MHKKSFSKKWKYKNQKYNRAAEWIGKACDHFYFSLFLINCSLVLMHKEEAIPCMHSMLQHDARLEVIKTFLVVSLMHRNNVITSIEQQQNNHFCNAASVWLFVHSEKLCSPSKCNPEGRRTFDYRQLFKRNDSNRIKYKRKK